MECLVEDVDQSVGVVLSHKTSELKIQENSIGSQHLAFAAIWLTDYIPAPLSVETQL